jgi:hypothetical protein
VTLTSVKDDAPQTLINIPTLIFALVIAATVFMRIMKHWELFNQASKTSGRRSHSATRPIPARHHVERKKRAESRPAHIRDRRIHSGHPRALDVQFLKGLECPEIIRDLERQYWQAGYRACPGRTYGDL